MRSVPRVMGFIGGTSDRPAPISDKEVDAIMNRLQQVGDKPRPKTLFEPGEMVRVNDGPFADFNGVVEEVDYEKSRLKVSVSIFGRATPVELDFAQVEKPKQRSKKRRFNRCTGRRLEYNFAPFVLWVPTRKTNFIHGEPLRGVITQSEDFRMAKKVQAYVKLQVAAGMANPSPPVGPALGQQGVNIMEFCKAFNAKTESMEKGLPIPVVITVYADRSFTFVTKTLQQQFC